MLRPVPNPPDRFEQARELLHLVEYSRPSTWLLPLLLLTLLGAGLVLSGLSWGGLLVGAAVSLALSRNGPHWWPGRR